MVLAAFCQLRMDKLGIENSMVSSFATHLTPVVVEYPALMTQSRLTGSPPKMFVHLSFGNLGACIMVASDSLAYWRFFVYSHRSSIVCLASGWETNCLSRKLFAVQAYFDRWCFSCDVPNTVSTVVFIISFITLLLILGSRLLQLSNVTGEDSFMFIMGHGTVGTIEESPELQDCLSIWDTSPIMVFNHLKTLALESGGSRRVHSPAPGQTVRLHHPLSVTCLVSKYNTVYEQHILTGRHMGQAKGVARVVNPCTQHDRFIPCYGPL
ncbi:predicted protein [Postia placenta Mad-698-R]|uniref:Uncharacterized protein n=1 Tax=Postia placenta MAD-698-R-SB12 TaxID=670580 RepID=A0A1X6MRP8_9APHY|nr:hypothetical protein POSPLADRAFT_1049186 [Postia placenta MAD-698-R-SB12]EED81616.1 predicted protein [Postia placenta Mad-698-R]OSX59048.1 hypothetical protein POSPLADRAFT_1049186 [Postia placenta MAD-698-R-SB12]